MKPRDTTDFAARALSPLFIPSDAPAGPLADMALANAPASLLRRAADTLPFNTLYDYIRGGARHMAEAGEARNAISVISSFDELLTRAGDPDRLSLDIHTALMQTLAGLHAFMGETDEALSAAASALALLAQEPKRKDEPFLSTLASMLFDLALIHSARAEYPQAERSMSKSVKLFDRLARANPERYGPAHVTALDTLAKVCSKAGDQADALRRCQEATASYLALTREGAMDDAIDRLATSLADQGVTLARMGRHREAIQYLSRALKYLTRIQPETDLRQLTLSTELGISLLLHKPTREKGIHLLNTMLHKATRLGADDLHRRIVTTLADARTPSRLDIIGVWHKVFPR
ncbi:MAG: tetratricopeptide repeat protein [Pseudoflavonifractor sp.]|nr:tetratricopeptide repeat protein [Alloprevotella sp.]MCM1117434.1 tetratricopeptide repeat protein [Pseudoflavonifractor sp.]